MNGIISQILLYNKGIPLIKIQSFQHRQRICFCCKVERKLLRSQPFVFHKILWKQIFLKRTQNHIVRQIISVFPFYDRVDGKRIHPGSILTYTFFPAGNNQRIIKSKCFTLLAESKVLVGIHQTKNTIFPRGNATNRKMSTAIRTGYSVKRQFRKCSIRQIGVHPHQHSFNRLQVGGFEQCSGYFHRINRTSGRESKGKIT